VLISDFLKGLLLPREVGYLGFEFLDFLVASKKLGRIVLILKFQLLAQFDKVGFVCALGQTEGRKRFEVPLQGLDSRLVGFQLLPLLLYDLAELPEHRFVLDLWEDHILLLGSIPEKEFVSSDAQVRHQRRMIVGFQF
jgi:hypothetical protein